MSQAIWSPSDHRLEPLRNPHRLGAHVRRSQTDGHTGYHVEGTEFSIVAPHASAVDLVLLDPDESAPGGLRQRTYALNGPTHGMWHGYLPGATVGQRYGFRAHGQWQPEAGLRFNPAKLLLDPYARAVVGDFQHVAQVYDHEVDENFAPLGSPWRIDSRDSAPFVRHGVITDLAAHPMPTRRPHTPWEDTVVYETHVKGLTRQLAGIPEDLRGTYAGLAHPVVIEHLRGLGVTTLELLPIHAKVSEPHFSSEA